MCCKIYSILAQAVGAETENATPLIIQGCVFEDLVAEEGFEPQEPVTHLETETSHRSAKSLQNKTLGDSSDPAPEQNLTDPKHSRNTSTHKKSVRRVYADGLPEDLAELVEEWPDLPEKVKVEILAKVRAVR
mgnify:CR=1 FL=1|jgi:hypothetical protein